MEQDALFDSINRKLNRVELINNELNVAAKHVLQLVNLCRDLCHTRGCSDKCRKMLTSVDGQLTKVRATLRDFAAEMSGYSEAKALLEKKTQ